MKKIYGILTCIILISSAIAGLYVGGYQMFLRPIMECCKAFDAGTLTGTMIGWTLIKCVFAGTVGGLIYGVGYIIALIFHYKY